MQKQTSSFTGGFGNAGIGFSVGGAARIVVVLFGCFAPPAVRLQAVAGAQRPQDICSWIAGGFLDEPADD